MSAQSPRATLVDGKAFSAALVERVAAAAKRLEMAHGIKPGLAVVIVGEDPASQLKAEELWPEESFELVERYNRHLGLDLPQHSQAHHERQREQVEEPHAVRTERRERGHDDDYDHGL